MSEITQLVTAGEVAEILGVTVGTVRRWARAGRIPIIRLSPRVLRFDPEAVLSALAAEAGAEKPGDAHQGAAR